MGVPKEYRQMEVDIARQQADLMRQLLGMGQRQIERGEQLQQPLIDISRAVLAGDESAIARLLAPAAQAVTQQTEAERENIYALTMPGVGRERALAELGRQAPTYMRQLVSQIWQQAPTTLANLGAQMLGVGQQAQQLGISASEAASRSIGRIMEAQAAAAQSRLGLIGNLLELLGMGLVMRPFRRQQEPLWQSLI